MISWAILVNALSISVLFMSSLDIVIIPYIDSFFFVIHIPFGSAGGGSFSKTGIKKPSPHWSGRLITIDDAAAHAASFTFSASQGHP
jgi:hypothetical protein